MARKRKTKTTSTSKSARSRKQRYKGLREGWRSGLEKKIGKQLNDLGIDYEYEGEKIVYEVPAREAKYTPDFRLPNGIYIESKGRFVAADRKKHLLIKKQCPDLDIRFVFTNPNARIYKGSPTTHAMWCERHGFQYAKQEIPEDWIYE